MRIDSIMVQRIYCVQRVLLRRPSHREASEILVPEPSLDKGDGLGWKIHGCSEQDMQRVDVREDARDGIKYRQMKTSMFCLKVTLCEKLKSPDFLPDTKLQDLLQDVLPLRFLHDAHSFQLSVRQSHQSPPWTKHAKWIWRLKVRRLGEI